jgi:hypothetical protein
MSLTQQRKLKKNEKKKAIQRGKPLVEKTLTSEGSNIISPSEKFKSNHKRSQFICTGSHCCN